MSDSQLSAATFEALVGPHLPALELRLHALAATAGLGLPQRHTVADQQPLAGAKLLELARKAAS